MIATSTPARLRDRQAELVRAQILDALVARLERESPNELGIDDLASDAGVSRRTLYRYFPNREALIAAAEERLVARLGLPLDFDGPDSIAASFREASHRLEQHPGLARALRQTTISRLHPPLRARRVQGLHRALEPATRGLPPVEAERALAIIGYLCSANAWLTIGDETSLPPDEVRAAISWAIDTLIGELRQRAHAPRQASTD
ncbi:MAG: TetR/AcrR family transcriptional regulator [Chloroflexi bacterium]|nr:TetR/AcrR family transcriptional regulator [Chloroflexota bacterium]